MKQDHISMNAFAYVACEMMLCFESIPFVVHAEQLLDASDQLRPSINEKNCCASLYDWRRKDE